MEQTAAAERERASELAFRRALDIEALRVLAEIQTILASNDGAYDKLKTIADLIFAATDDDDDGITGIDFRPRT